MATGATAGVKRSRSDVPVYCAHLAAKRSRAAPALPVDVGALLRSDGADGFRFESRARTLDMTGLDSGKLSLLHRLVEGAILALIDLNVHSSSVSSILEDFTRRGASVVDLNIRSHAYCMGDKNDIARAFISGNQQYGLVCDVLKFVVSQLFAQENTVALRVLSGGGVRDVLLADWCRQFKFCTAANAPTPNVVIVTAESGRTFMIPFAA